MTAFLGYPGNFLTPERINKRMKFILILVFLFETASFQVQAQACLRDTKVSEEMTIALDLINQDKFADAEKRYTDVIILCDSAQQAFAQRGYARLRLEKYELAIKDFDKALKLDSKDYTVMANRALTWWYLSAPLAAEADAKEAIRIAPRYALGHYTMGLAKFSTSRYKEAEAHFTTSLELDPTYELAYFNRGITRIYLHKATDACTDWDEAESLGHPIPPKFREDYCRNPLPGSAAEGK